MAGLLRKVRSSISASQTHGKPPKSCGPSPIDFSKPVHHSPSESTRPPVSTLHNHSFSSPVSQFRRRLKRKTSTSSLRRKDQKGEKNQVPPPQSPHKSDSQNTFVDGKRQRDPSHLKHTLEGCHQLHQEEIKTEKAADTPPLQHTQTQVRVGNWAKMASTSQQPPVEYTKLKDIASRACDAILQDRSSYVHAETEGWNTAIINSILSELVKETSEGGTQQPHWKYVVNSTIIQHAPTSSSTAATATADPEKEGPKKVSGRRGMHSASGAFWNNQRDGMWSYKYEAADAKGLDVIIGIIWIWVG